MSPAPHTAVSLGSWPLVAPFFLSGFVCGAVWLRRRIRLARDRRSDLVHSAGVLAHQEIASSRTRAKPATKLASVIVRRWRVHRHAYRSFARRLFFPGARPGRQARRGKERPFVVMSQTVAASGHPPGVRRSFHDGNHFSIRHWGRQ
jgi:hypothetical protein